MFLPEHKEQLLERNREKKQFDMPELHEDQLAHIGRTLAEAAVFGKIVTVVYAARYGPKSVSGRIVHIRPGEAWFKLTVNEGDDPLLFPFTSILAVETD